MRREGESLAANHNQSGASHSLVILFPYIVKYIQYAYDTKLEY